MQAMMKLLLKKMTTSKSKIHSLERIKVQHAMSPANSIPHSQYHPWSQPSGRIREQLN